MTAARLIGALFLVSTAVLAAQAPLGNDAWHKVVFENPQMRVLSVEVPPGATTDEHRHDFDIVTVYCAAGRLPPAGVKVTVRVAASTAGVPRTRAKDWSRICTFGVSRFTAFCERVYRPSVCFFCANSSMRRVSDRFVPSVISTVAETLPTSSVVPIRAGFEACNSRSYCMFLKPGDEMTTFTGPGCIPEITQLPSPFDVVV